VGDDPPPSHGLSVREAGGFANLAHAGYNCVRSEQWPLFSCGHDCRPL